MENISKKSPPSVADNPAMQRIVSQMYADLNSLIDSINKSGTSGKYTGKDTGKEGDIRIAKLSDNTYSLEVRSSDGWLKSTSDVFTLKDKLDF